MNVHNNISSSQIQGRVRTEASSVKMNERGSSHVKVAQLVQHKANRLVAKEYSKEMERYNHPEVKPQDWMPEGKTIGNHIDFKF